MKRREVKAGKPEPLGFVKSDYDSVTGKTVGWMPIGYGPEDRWHQEGLKNTSMPGTYELIGPKVQGNPYNLVTHSLILHGAIEIPLSPLNLTFHGLLAWMEVNEHEGIVWHNPDGRMAKLKRRDFGFKWPIAAD